jgi:cobalt-zinc-cadmium efflux system protein
VGHDHAHGAGHGNRRRLAAAIIIIGVFLVVEVVGAWISGSLALLADAGHMLSDLIALVVALVATVVAARPATDRQTFGYQRVEVFAALINGAALLVIAVIVSIEAISRLIEPGTIVRGGPMLWVAIAGLVANAVALLVLRGGASSTITMRSAYLEVLADLLGSVAAVIAAVVILTTGFAQADSIATLAIAVMIVPRALLLLRDVVRVLSESTPVGTDVAEIRRHILETNGVVDVHDVHVWAITSGAPVFSAHVVVEKSVFVSGDTGQLLDQLGGCLSDHFDVAHSTFQLEPAEHAAHEDGVHR